MARGGIGDAKPVAAHALPSIVEKEKSNLD